MLKPFVDTTATVGGNELLLTGIRDAFSFENGVRGAQVGYSLDCVCPKKAYAPLTVKLITDKLSIPAPQPGETIPVRFEGLTLGLYVRDNRICITASADGVALVNSKQQ